MCTRKNNVDFNPIQNTSNSVFLITKPQHKYGLNALFVDACLTLQTSAVTGIPTRDNCGCRIKQNQTPDLKEAADKCASKQLWPQICRH